VTGFGPVRLASANMGDALEGSDVIMIVTPSTAHYNLATLMAPFLKDGQIVVLIREGPEGYWNSGQS